MMWSLEKIESLIVDVPDFPKEGILFKDITPIVGNHEAFASLAKHFAESIPAETDKILAIESRGFILGAAVAQYTRAGLVLVRKKGKLPREVLSYTYELEYGTDTLEVQKADIQKGDKVIILDDVLATGGTAHATEIMCKELGAEVLGHRFLMEIEFLKGREKLSAESQAFIQC